MMTEHNKYFDNEIQKKLEQLPRAIEGSAPIEKLKKICLEIHILKDAKEALNIHTVMHMLLCVDTLKHWKVTKGLKYKLVKETEFHYTLIDDLGNKDTYNKDWFKKCS